MFDTTGASCQEVDPEMFFPVASQEPQEAKNMRALCAGCPVNVECLTYALENDVMGIWAGTNHEMRKQIRKERGIVAKRLDGQIKAILDIDLLSKQTMNRRKFRLAQKEREQQ